MQIAGRLVKINDSLYHTGWGMWGRITAEDSGSMVMTFSNDTGNRKIRVAEGGVVNGKRQVYWHEPLVLDEPTHNVAKFQAAVAFAKELLA